jgi:hypothetical protein
MTLWYQRLLKSISRTAISMSLLPRNGQGNMRCKVVTCRAVASSIPQQDDTSPVLLLVRFADLCYAFVIQMMSIVPSFPCTRALVRLTFRSRPSLGARSHCALILLLLLSQSRTTKTAGREEETKIFSFMHI